MTTKQISLDKAKRKQMSMRFHEEDYEFIKEEAKLRRLSVPDFLVKLVRESAQKI
jgi:uncharacterized protein (DUF1778 family)